MGEVEQELRRGRSSTGTARHVGARRFTVDRVSPVSAALLAAAALALAVHLVVPPSAVRAAVTLTFLLLCPGLAVVRLLRLPSRLIVLTLSIALSLVLDQVTAMVSMYAGGWSPSGCLAALALVTAAAALAPHVRQVLSSGGGAHARLAR